MAHAPVSPAPSVKPQVSRLQWLRVGLPYAGAAVALMSGPFVAAAPAWVEYTPLVLSLVLFGMPHGALDHMVPLWMDRRRPRVGWLLGFGLAYLAVSGLYLGLWLVVPVLSAGSFIALTLYHWGQGDLYTLLGAGWGHHLGSQPKRAT
ncbi:MAG: Brp/Blh family beta-carotene 15,15'-dioxygenase, partial [Bacteroidota bacterium]